MTVAATAPAITTQIWRRNVSSGDCAGVIDNRAESSLAVLAPIIPSA
jgi:hypothetical protein